MQYLYLHLSRLHKVADMLTNAPRINSDLNHVGFKSVQGLETDTIIFIDSVPQATGHCQRYFFSSITPTRCNISLEYCTEIMNLMIFSINNSHSKSKLKNSRCRVESRDDLEFETIFMVVFRFPFCPCSNLLSHTLRVSFPNSFSLLD